MPLPLHTFLPIDLAIVASAGTVDPPLIAVEVSQSYELGNLARLANSAVVHRHPELGTGSHATCRAVSLSPLTGTGGDKGLPSFIRRLRSPRGSCSWGAFSPCLKIWVSLAMNSFYSQHSRTACTDAVRWQRGAATHVPLQRAGLFGLDGGVRLWLAWSKNPTNEQLMQGGPDIGRRPPVRRIVEVDPDITIANRIPLSRKAPVVASLLGADNAADPDHIPVDEVDVDDVTPVDVPGTTPTRSGNAGISLPHPYIPCA